MQNWRALKKYHGFQILKIHCIYYSIVFVSGVLQSTKPTYFFFSWMLHIVWGELTMSWHLLHRSLTTYKEHRY